MNLFLSLALLALVLLNFAVTVAGVIRLRRPSARAEIVWVHDDGSDKERAETAVMIRTAYAETGRPRPQIIFVPTRTSIVRESAG